MKLYDGVTKKLRRIVKQHEEDSGGSTEESSAIAEGISAINELMAALMSAEIRKAASERALENLTEEYREILFRVMQAEALIDYYQSEYAGEWVPVSSGMLPADRQRVLTLGRNRGIQICRFESDGEGGGDFITARQGVAVVRGWMPLPGEEMQ